MKVLFDTNIILDVLLDREPFTEYSTYLMTKVEKSEIIGYLGATTITTIYYLLQKSLGNETAADKIETLLSIFEIVPVNRLILEGALKSGFSDFEDSVLHEGACHVGVEYIITRDTKGFKKSKMPVFKPIEFINMLISINEKG